MECFQMWRHYFWMFNWEHFVTLAAEQGKVREARQHPGRLPTYAQETMVVDKSEGFELRRSFLALSEREIRAAAPGTVARIPKATLKKLPTVRVPNAEHESGYEQLFLFPDPSAPHRVLTMKSGVLGHLNSMYMYSCEHLWEGQGKEVYKFVMAARPGQSSSGAPTSLPPPPVEPRLVDASVVKDFSRMHPLQDFLEKLGRSKATDKGDGEEDIGDEGSHDNEGDSDDDDDDGSDADADASTMPTQIVGPGAAFVGDGLSAPAVSPAKSLGNATARSTPTASRRRGFANAPSGAASSVVGSRRVRSPGSRSAHDAASSLAHGDGDGDDMDSGDEGHACAPLGVCTPGPRGL